ncbi:MAG: hypothetical protein HC850_00415 [Rhodomicrobium sp.]|nr:hypothetical protein [Rhodomicrobium sp.]
MASKALAIALFAAPSLLMIALSAPANAQEQRDQARANFEQADVNKDELLDRAEFTTFINLNADDGLGRAPMIRSLDMYGRAFGTADTNGDGMVSKQEIASQAQH